MTCCRGCTANWFRQALVTLPSAGSCRSNCSRFATGTYALWYPVVLRQQIKRMIHDLEATGIRK
ncbi:hypothetical protein CW355_10120, partial [Haemophilus influenzae]